MATARRVSFCFFCDAHLWCQVSRTLLQYFQRYRLFSIFHFFVANRMTSSLHNRKMSISLKRKKILQKEKRHSSVFWKAFQISTKHFSFRRHFKLKSFIRAANVNLVVLPNATRHRNNKYKNGPLLHNLCSTTESILGNYLLNKFLVFYCISYMCTCTCTCKCKSWSLLILKQKYLWVAHTATTNDLVQLSLLLNQFCMLVTLHQD